MNAYQKWWLKLNAIGVGAGIVWMAVIAALPASLVSTHAQAKLMLLGLVVAIAAAMFARRLIAPPE
jgi:hypothetical protein